MFERWVSLANKRVGARLPTPAILTPASSEASPCSEGGGRTPIAVMTIPLVEEHAASLDCQGAAVRLGARRGRRSWAGRLVAGNFEFGNFVRFPFWAGRQVSTLTSGLGVCPDAGSDSSEMVEASVFIRVAGVVAEGNDRRGNLH